MTRTILKALALAGALLAAAASADDAHAAGLYFSDRGVRPLGRGGAFVAGADDLGAIWYNPAGLVDAPSGILFDASWLHYTSEFSRQTIATSATGTQFVQSFPTVNGSTPILPVPTLAGSLRFGDHDQYAVALGMFAPMVPVTSYPQTISNTDGSTSPAPQRYSLVSLDGSALVVTGAWFAWKPVEELRIGVGFEALVGTFKSTVDFSACPQDNIICAGEQPDYDAFSQLTVGPIFAPSGNAGATIVPSEHLRFGLSGQLPFWVDAPAKVDVRLPNAVLFDGATQQGDDARVKFELPAIVRLGVEVRPLDKAHDLRVEATYVHEFWSEHQSIDITPTDVLLYNVKTLPSPFAVSSISIPRGGTDSNSVRLGGEYMIPVDDYRIQVRAGVGWESSGIQEAYVSPLTVDSSKVTAAIGGGLYIGKHWRLDAVLAHVFASDVTVTPQEASVPRVNPVKGNPTQETAVNGGHYSSRADVVGVGLQFLF
ncbi:MAG TPA: outer membrane protein transport protein [Polyangiaceae bacterium]